jgi:hypothetical protein
MTELWDNGFGQAEIRTVFEEAIRDMPRYAAGQERRGSNWDTIDLCYFFRMSLVSFALEK